MAKVKVLPSFLSCWHPKRSQPCPALMFYFIIILIFIFAANLDQLNQLNTVEYIAQWTQKAVSASLLLFIRVARLPVNNVYRINILFPVLYLVCLFSMTLSTIFDDWTTVIFMLVSTVAGLLIYWIFLWKKGLRRFWIYKRIQRNMDGKFALI